jgi:hypothetical protein
MQKVRLFAKCFKTWYNSRVWINPNFMLDFFPKVLTNLFKTTSTGTQATVVMPAISNSKDDCNSMSDHNSRSASNSRNESNNRTANTEGTPAKAEMLAK